MLDSLRALKANYRVPEQLKIGFNFLPDISKAFCALRVFINFVQLFELN